MAGLLRRIVIACSTALLLTAIILLLNFTAPNPTGRRYSSASPYITGTAYDIGESAEIILSSDLGVPKNGVNYDGVIPDFVTAFDLIESKNCQVLPCENRGQFERLLTLSEAQGVPLWVFVRVDTYVPSSMIAQVEATGGGVVPYFTVPGYIDLVDQFSTYALAGGGIVLMLAGTLEIVTLRRQGASIRSVIQSGVQFVSNQTRNRVLIGVLIILVAALLLNTNIVRASLSTLQQVAALAFYTLGAIWFLKHL